MSVFARRARTVLTAASLGALGACGSERHEGLPFYRSLDRTPEWVDASVADGPRMHRVPSFAFSSHRGEQVTNSDLTGRVTLVHFFYASCGRVCPRAVGSIQRLLHVLRNDSTMQVLSYTVQPARDSVQSLAAYAVHNAITDTRWHLLTGDEEAITSLAISGYFVNLRDGSAYGTDDLAHTETLVLVDQHARIRGMYNATLPLDMEQIARDVKALEVTSLR